MNTLNIKYETLNYDLIFFFGGDKEKRRFSMSNTSFLCQRYDEVLPVMQANIMKDFYLHAAYLFHHLIQGYAIGATDVALGGIIGSGA